MTQTYEEYWKLTLEYTDFNDDRFITTLRLVIKKIDILNANGDYTYKSSDYQELQQEILSACPKTSSNIKNQLASTRKAINQCVKLGFVNPKLQSYHPLAIEYINAKTNKKRELLFSKIVYSNSSFNRSVSNESSIQQINFLIQTLIEIGKLTKEEIIALMLVDIENYEREFIPKEELLVYVKKARDSKFIERKYNQVGYLYNLLEKLEDLVFLEETLYFKEDAEQIQDIRSPTRKRDPYLHRLYKRQLEEECTEVYGNAMCVLERLSYPVLIASHIKPFIESNEDEAYDPNNGLLLSRTIDSLFDLKYISFSDEGNILFSERLSPDVKSFWKDYKLDTCILNEKRVEYLSYHRNLMIEKDRQISNTVQNIV